MQIKIMTIEGLIDDVTIRRSERGAVICANDVEIEFERRAEPEECFGVARNVAEIVYGIERKGGPNASNSMINDLLRAIEQVAGC